MLLYGLMVSVGLLYARGTDPVMTNIIEFVRNFITYLIVINTATTRTRLRRILGRSWPRYICRCSRYTSR